MHFSGVVQNEKRGFVILCINFNVVSVPGPPKRVTNMHSKVKREYLTESRKFDWRAKHRSFLWSPNSNLTKFQDPNFYRTLIYGMTTIGLESYSSASKALLSNYRKEGVFLLCIFRVQETVNRVSLLLLAEDYACLIFFTYIENCIPQILSQLEKLVCMGSSCFKDATLRSFLKLRIQQHSTTAEVRRVSEFPFAIGSRSIVYVCAQQRAKNVSKYSNILMPSRASSSYFFPLGCSWCYYFQGVD